MSHFVVTFLLAILLSAIIALTGDRGPRQGLYHAIYMFSLAIAAVIAGGWIMFFIET
jgi:hypothetical protein